MSELIFYTTAGCHLCEDAQRLLEYLISETGVSVEVVDISSSEALVDLYGIRIPVVKNAASETELGWPFGYEELLELVASRS